MSRRLPPAKKALLAAAILVALMLCPEESVAQQSRKNETRKDKGKMKYEDEDLFCSGEKASFGLSIGTPSEVLWETARAAPFSVCLLCSDADEESPYLQEACTYYGESRRATMVQKFECVRGEFLRGFSGANASAESSPLDSRLRCRFPEKGDRKKKDSTYQVAFPPSRQSTRRARINWRNWDKLNMRCNDRDSFICGVRIRRPVRGRAPPMIEPRCCDVSYGKSNKGGGSPAKFQSLTDLGGGGGKAAVAVLAVICAILAVALLLCIVNVWWYDIRGNCGCAPNTNTDRETRLKQMSGKNRD